MDPTIRLLKQLIAIDSINPSLVPGAAGEAAAEVASEGGRRWPRHALCGSQTSAASASFRRGLAAGPAVLEVAPEVLRKARRMSPGTGLVAGLFGSVVGVGGGVVIVPLIVSACRNIPQRRVSRLRFSQGFGHGGNI